MRSVFRQRQLAFLLSSAWLLAAAPSHPAFAASDGQPLVLDSKTGIHDGQSGIVLQNAPLVSEPMVPAQSLPVATELAPQGQPPIVVSPYIDLSPDTSAPRGRHRIHAGSVPTQ